MITGRFAFVLLAAAVAGGCGGLGSFNIDLPGDTEIPSPLQHVTDPYVSGAAAATVQQTIANKGVKSNEIQSAEITAGYLSVSSPDAQYMKDIASFAIYVEAPGLAKVEIARQSGAPFTQQPAVDKVSLQIDAVSMKPYITASSMTLTAVPVFQGTPPATAGVPLHVDLTLHVQAQIP